jgi:hypothetical protein
MKGEGFAVFYDSFYPETLWGKNLIEFFDDIYRKQAQYLRDAHFAGIPRQNVDPNTSDAALRRARSRRGVQGIHFTDRCRRRGIARLANRRRDI